MSGDAEPSNPPKPYHFHTQWEAVIFKFVCLLCKSTTAILKKGNVKWLCRTVHKIYDTDFSPKSELGKRKVK